MEKRALIALVISFLIFIGFGYVQQKFLPHPPPVPKSTEEQPAPAKKPQSSEPVTAPVPPSPPLAGEQKPEDVVVVLLFIEPFLPNKAPGSRALD